MEVIAKLSILCILFACGLAMPHSKEAISTEIQPPLPTAATTKYHEVQPVLSPSSNANQHKESVPNIQSYGFLQTVRKEWKCANGQCTEQVTKCKNGRCDSVENRFKANNYQPEMPQVAPFPFPTFNFAEFFNFAFPKFNLESFFDFDNFGMLDSVVDTKNDNNYFIDAKIITSKCQGHECLIKTKDCKNGKCNEISERRSF